jgi:hypothetical protein
LSGIVASELLLRGPGDGTDEGKGAGLQGAEILGNAHDFIQTIISQKKLPITNLPIFQHPLNDIGSMLGKVNLIPVNIPEDAVRKALYAFLPRHTSQMYEKDGKFTISE